MPDDTEYAIIEIGMNRAGEIRNLTKIVKPDIAVITWVSEAHLEYFKSVQDIADAKSEVFEGLPKNGIAIINLDNKYYGRIMFNLERLGIQNKNIYTFGKREGANSRLKSYENLGSKVSLVYEVNAKVIDLHLPFIGEHYVRNFAAVFMVASVLSLDLHKAALQLDKVELMDGRGKIINATLGEKKCQIICDYYNANPASFIASLEYFKQINHSKKIAIIGDMLELGETSPVLHKSLVPLIIDSGAKKVFLVGTNVKYIYESLPRTINSIYFDNLDSLLSKLDNLIDGNELILIKGSRGMALDKIIQHFQVI
jgi:UDP-N-acetylmuramoyl-tripeptide--D-alanyl-D-alanine ligase